MDQESSGIVLVYVCVCEGGVGRLGCGFILLYSICYILYSIFYTLYSMKAQIGNNWKDNFSGWYLTFAFVVQI